MNILTKILQHNWLAIFYFNFKMLPLKQAIKLPFDFYRHVRFEDISGKIVLNPSHIHRAMIKVGGRGSEMFPHVPVIIDIKGSLTFNGITEIGNGCLLRVEDKGKLTFGNKVRIGACSKIICEESITFGNEIGISWESQVFDTNFHYMQEINSEKIFPKTTPIIIGSYNWFGNRVNIMKGTITPDYIITASNSLLNKDYTQLPVYSVLAGTPAKLVKSGIKRMFEGIDL